MKLKTILAAAMILCSCQTDDETQGQGTDGAKWGEQPAPPVVAGEESYQLGGNDYYVNVMGNTLPRSPKFPELKVKAGVLRGYVADLSGKPLKGAYIGVRATVIGGSYSGASAETDDNGYYEISLPIGAVHYYATGYTIDYGQTRAVVGLHPVDDNISGFASANGAVENFVMLSYGVGNKDNAAQQPSYSNNYYGGAISLDYQVDWDNNRPNYLPDGGDIEIVLSPEEKGLYGEERTFKITKKIGLSKANILNIPVGKYTITAKLKDGRKLKMKEVGTYAGYYPALGMKPTDAIGSATVLFTPSVGRTPSMVPAHGGNWDAVQIYLELP